MRIARRSSLAVVLGLLWLPAICPAADLEIAGFAGYTFPFYSQTFSYGPGPINVPIPDVSITQNGSFELKAKGGAAFGGSLGLFPVHGVGFEVRLDSSKLKVEAQNATFDVRVTLPQPLQPIESTLDLTEGSAELRTANSFSLNLKVRTPGQTHLYASGGLSHLGDLQFSLHQNVALGVTALNLVTNNLEIGTIELRAQVPLDKQGSSWGGNLGLGFQIGLGEHGGLMLEARGFVFPKRTAEWQGVIDTPLTPLEQELLDRALASLPPVEIKPWWVQATIGVSYRF